VGRSKKKRIPKSAIAIVGEGESEWHYFTAIKSVERYPFKVTPELPKHSSISAIIKKAVSLIDDGYDRVYCVLDLDTICNQSNDYRLYKSKKAKAVKKSKGKIIFIESMPCIEIWFLMHFVDYSTKEYLDYNSIKVPLKKFIPDYDKTVKFFESNNFYQRLISEGSINNAVKIAERLEAEFDENSSITFPRTSMNELIEYLNSKK